MVIYLSCISVKNEKLILLLFCAKENFYIFIYNALEMIT